MPQTTMRERFSLVLNVQENKSNSNAGEKAAKLSNQDWSSNACQDNFHNTQDPFGAGSR